MKFTMEHEVITFVDRLEKFILAVNVGRLDPAGLNKARTNLEEFISEQCGLVETSVAESTTFKCPDCNGEMLLRTNRENGDKFWGCKSYPNCRGTRDSSGLSKAERAAEKAKAAEVSQQAGFRFRKS